MHKAKGCKSQHVEHTFCPSHWELWICATSQLHVSLMMTSYPLFDSLGLVLCKRNIQIESSNIQQDPLFASSLLKSFCPLHFLSLTESFSFTSLRKMLLRSSPASRAIRATIWPAVPITMLM